MVPYFVQGKYRAAVKLGSGPMPWHPMEIWTFRMAYIVTLNTMLEFTEKLHCMYIACISLSVIVADSGAGRSPELRKRLFIAQQSTHGYSAASKGLYAQIYFTKQLSSYPTYNCIAEYELLIPLSCLV